MIMLVIFVATIYKYLYTNLDITNTNKFKFEAIN